MGEGQEIFGEDPYVLSRIGVAYTEGLQIGEDPKYIKIAACAPCFAAHDGPEDIRLHFIANISQHDLFDSFLPAFKSQVHAANVSQIMPAYSGVRCEGQPDGAPDAANGYLLKTVLREKFGATNVSVMSDNGGIGGTYTAHHYVSSFEDAAAVCMNASTDLDLGHDEIYKTYLMKAVEDEKVAVAGIKAAVWRSLHLRIRLGDFDPLSMVYYQQINASHLNTPAHKELNLLAAQQSIVLLKNTGVLPLDASKISKLALIGPNAKATTTLLSDYAGIADNIVSIEEGIMVYLNGSDVELVDAVGCASVECPDDSGFKDAQEAAKGADAVVMVMGLDNALEGEGHDRKPTKCNGKEQDVISLPGCQSLLIQSVIATNPKIVMVLINAGPLSFPELIKNEGLLAVVEAFYPGALGGKAVASVLFGEYNPAGRMPVTTYTSSIEQPDPTNYDMSKPPGRTYRYYTGLPMIPFGYGLSYTWFDYWYLILSKHKIHPCESVTVSVRVTNGEDMAGEEVIQMYIKSRKRRTSHQPHFQLIGFERVSIEPSGTHTQEFVINPYLMSLVDDNGDHVLFPGLYDVYVAGALPVDSMVGMAKSVADNFTIKGSGPMLVSSCTGVPLCLAC